QSTTSKGKGLLILLALGALVAIVALVVFVNGGGNGDPKPPEQENRRLTLTRTALAATENLQPVEADAIWSELLQLSPQDESVALNRALNRILRVSLLTEQALNPTAEEAKRTEARFQCPTAIDAARAAIEDYQTISQDKVLPLWMDSRVDLYQAALLVGPMTRPLPTYNKLVKAIQGEAGQSPRSIVLAGPLFDAIERLADPLDGLAAELRQGAAGAFGQLARKHPDNLFITFTAAQLGVASEDQQIAPAVLQTYRLAKAIEPILARETKPLGMTPEQLVNKIAESVHSADWEAANYHMSLWFNVLNPTELMRTDRRRASPHPLDRLSFDSLRTLSAAAIEKEAAEKSSAAVSFDCRKLDQAGKTAIAIPVDYDIDLVDDLVTVSVDAKLQMWRNAGDGQWTPDGEITLPHQPLGLLAVDLFMVDETHPDRLRTVDSGQQAGGQQAGGQQADGRDQADSASRTSQPVDLSSSKRHDVFPSLLAFGPEGAQIISVDGRPNTAPSDRLRLATHQSGLEDVSGILAAAAGDLEGDGDLDLVLATETDGVRLFVNRGDRSFFEIEYQRGEFENEDPVTAMIIADLDRDLDLDIITVHAKSGRVGQLENLLHLQFRGRFFKEIPLIKGVSFVSVADVDANVSWDLVLGGEEQSAIVFSQTAEASIWTVDRVETSDQPAGAGLLADFDNDSWSDLISSAGQTLSYGDPYGAPAVTWSDLISSAGQTHLQRIGPWGFDAPVSLASSPFRQAGLANFNSDGKVDFVCLRGQSVEICTNTTSTAGHFINVRFLGIRDNAANSGRVNHYGVGSVLELRFGPHYRSQIITSPVTHFGLGVYDQPSSIRIIMPNGLTQTIRDPGIDTLVEEKQQLKGSCPYLYAWDGQKFVFITDCLWAAPLGLQVARGVVAKDRPWEYLKVEG
ncbi:MAG: FG-GAP-like repeat-containing protein, partial [Pirellulales bacterium]|nr:FG-GAP-like repeat-containing protein [Pirellulales bacterium]